MILLGIGIIIISSLALMIIQNLSLYSYDKIHGNICSMILCLLIIIGIIIQIYIGAKSGV